LLFVDKKIRIIGIIAALAFSAYVLTSDPNPPPLPKPTTNEIENKYVEILATNLEKPRAIAFAENKIFVTEQVGRIRVIEDGKLLEEPLATLRGVNVFDGGLLGIATHPNFSENNILYVFLTYEENGDIWNKILKITVSNNKLQDAETIFDKIPASRFNNGGIIKFGQDKKLYIATGVVSESSHAAQDLNSLEGKILRLNDDGSIPDDNPFPNSPVFSYGHKNPQGMTWDNLGNLYVTDLGPSKNDEINIVKAAKNYGWPEQQCSGNSEFEDAIMCYDPSIEPGGIIFYSNDNLPFTGNLIMATLRTEILFSLEIREDGIENQQSILSGIGRIRDVNVGPDGYLYVITSNTDGKGFPSSTDDKVIRIIK